MKIITIPERIADAIFDKKECAFVGAESIIESAEPEALCCDGGSTTSLSSSQNARCPSILLKAVL